MLQTVPDLPFRSMNGPWIEGLELISVFQLTQRRPLYITLQIRKFVRDLSFSIGAEAFQ
jgi:hypothetical protein